MIRKRTRAADAVSRYLNGLALGALLGTVAWLLLTGNDTAFLHPRFRLFLMGGALLLAIFAMVVLIGPQRMETGLSLAGAIAPVLVLMIPLLFLSAVVRQGLGAHALNRKYTGAEQQTLTRLLENGRTGSQETGQTPHRSLLEIARQMKQLDGKRVITEGLVYRPAIMPPNYLTLFRFAIFCCAADALPVWLFVEHPDVADFDDEAWIRVDGTVRIVDFNGTEVPVIKADTIAAGPAPPPGEQYLFF